MDSLAAIQEAVKHTQKIKETMRPDLAERITDKVLDISFWMKHIAPIAWFQSERELVGFVFLIIHKHVHENIVMKTEKEIAELPDDLNPKYMFNMTATTILVDIASGKIDAVDYARTQLANRGIGKSGVWVGFAEAAKQWEVQK